MARDGGRGASIDGFIAKWLGQAGGQERANYALFLTELCDALDLPHPEPASAEHGANDYVFERVVQEIGRDGAVSSRRIDLYKRDSFVLEAKQSRQKGGDKEVQGQSDLFVTAAPSRGRRGAERAWDVLMLNARRQAEDYVRLLPKGHDAPPFVLVCDVGHCFEVYANFRRDGKAFDQFPDRQSFRIFLEDLRRQEVQELIRSIWLDPDSLDPARKSARVTRAIAERLAAVSKALERDQNPPEDVAMFLMRCLFTMFAEDVGLLPEKSFTNVLERCEKAPETFELDVGQLWEAMDQGGYAHAIRMKVARFNGDFFAKRTVLPLERAEIGELRQAALYDWRDVDPSIFGTLLEQALDPNERKRLGAHFTPRAYVERLVIATVIEPLREEWGQVISTAERQKSERRVDDAIASVRAFHDALCATRVLDPACGTGNFLYVALELLKRLEGEVLEALADLGGQEALVGLEGHTVDPHQFLGMEINPRAAAIAELVLWIGYLQWHARTKGGVPSEPILRAFKNIVVKDAVLVMDPPRRSEWPVAEYIVGNPPFIGKGEFMRVALGDAYIDALSTASPQMQMSADFVMYWWDRAAELLTRKGTVLRRFGFVTTNSITQVFNRRVVDRHLRADRPISLVMAIADHPWTKATTDAAAVRIAMTVCEAGAKDGVLHVVLREHGLDTEAPQIDFQDTGGRINSDLTVGADVTSASALRANDGLGSMGPALGGRGFVVTRSEALALGAKASEPWLRRLTAGRDITGGHRNRLVIDVRSYPTEDALQKALPKVYQHLRLTVYPDRLNNNDLRLRTYWWRYRRSNEIYFAAVDGLARFIATVETTKHRVFVFLDKNELVEHGVVGFGLNDGWCLGVLSSRVHVVWALANGGTLEDRPRYNKDVCFDPFPFPAADDLQKQRIRVVAEDLDAHRKQVLADHPHLTLTGLYNVLEQLRAGVAPNDLEPVERRIFDDGLVLIMKEMHDKLDALVAAAYGWPVDLSDEDILARLVALNKERAKEEARGQIRWLRPEYQIPLFGTPKEKAELELVGGAVGGAAATVTATKTTFPTDEVAQTAAVMSALATAAGPVGADAVATSFRQGRRIAPKVAAVLAALARMGFVDSVDGGRSFILRRAA